MKVRMLVSAMVLGTLRRSGEVLEVTDAGLYSRLLDGRAAIPLEDAARTEWLALLQQEQLPWVRRWRT